MKDLDDKLEKSWHILIEKFPFSNYINPARKSGYFDMVRKIAKWAGTDAKVLDFGSGPCDKTALFSLVGMDVTAFDTLEDTWHTMEGNREKILDFAKNVGIDFRLPRQDSPLPFMEETYDVIMSHDVLEHFHSSPRPLLNTILQCLKPGGILAITVPNAANLRKRLHLLIGKTNYNRFDYFYWYPGKWNGHVREYVKSDLEQLNDFLCLQKLELSTYHLQLDVLPAWARAPYKAATVLAPGVRDSWMLIARKPENWEPQYEPTPDQFDKALNWHYFDLSSYEHDWERLQ